MTASGKTAIGMKNSKMIPSCAVQAKPLEVSRMIKGIHASILGLLSLTSFAQEPSLPARQSIDPLVSIRERGRSGAVTQIPREPVAPIPSLSEIAVSEDRIIAELAPSESVRKGLDAIFTYRASRRGDVVIPVSKRAAATVLKTTARLGLMLLKATVPAGVSYPDFADPVVGDHVRWLRSPRGDFPQEYH
jgi:hypothetical protein